MASSPGRVLDPALPALTRALDPNVMHASLNQATARRAPGHEVRVLSHKTGQRCTILYRPLSGSGSDGAVIGKLYRSRRRAARMYARQRELAALAFAEAGRTGLPDALMFIEELGLVLQTAIDGVDLRHFVEEDAGVAPLELAGQWLARLHACAPPEGLRYVPAHGRLARMRGWVDEIEPGLPASERTELRRGLEGAAAALVAKHRPSPVVIHKDFYYANLLWDGTRLWGLDLDELGVGDAAFDVGHFLAHLERHTWRTGHGIEGAADSGRRFLRSYEELAGDGARTLTPFYKGYTFVKLAATEAARRRDGWRTAAATLAGFGRRELAEFAGQPSSVRPST